ncbi:hypothetical protein [Flavobacterium suncheonense]|uniref:hypothetical protein n=1 Tax=Flavobacterium suncheonense TaxID=350894 RepID=UPI003FA3B8FA
MQQNFLRHLWLVQQFESSGLKTVREEPFRTLHSGCCLLKTASYFFNAQIFTGALRRAGGVTVCNHDRKVKSSDETELSVLEWQSCRNPEIVRYSQNTHVKKILKFVTDLWD